jgi:hypothetical protein
MPAVGRRACSRAVVVAVALTVLAGALTGCTPKTGPMPMLLDLRDDGWLTAAIPICAGDRVTFGALFIPFGSAGVTHREAPQPDSDDRILVLDLSANAVARGSLSADLPVTAFEPYPEAPSELADLGHFRITTTRFRVSADLDSSLFDSEPYALVFGVEGTDENAYISPVTREVGEEAIETWCAEQGA